MIQTGNTIVVHNENETLGFFWLCEIRPDGYVFFDWLGNPRRPSVADYWVVSKDWLRDRLADGRVEVFNSLPLDVYGDEFEQLAVARNR